ncbi:MAG: hypothetical protein ACR2PY_03975, partial [Salinispira sp.]
TLHTENSKFQNIVGLYFYLFIDEKDGVINEKNWKKALSIFKSENISYREYLSKDKKQVGGLRVNYTTLIDDDLYDVVILNKNYHLRLTEEFSEVKKIEERRSKPVSVFHEVLFEESRDLREDEFEYQYNKLLSDITNNNVESISELLCSFGVLLQLLKHNIIQGSIEHIESIITENFDRNIKQGKYEFKYSSLRSWAGYGFLQSNSVEMKKMIEYFQKIKDQLKKDKLRDEFQELVINLEDNLGTISKEIVATPQHGVYSSGKFFDEPFFSYIENKEGFFNRVVSLPMYKMDYFMNALKQRYISNYSDDSTKKVASKEKEFINTFHSFIENKKQKESPRYNPAVIRYDLLLQHLSEIKNQFEKTKPENPEGTET